ncbi:MAG: hypothetical protein WBA62_03730 [Xanthobacteraceae bacterium]
MRLRLHNHEARVKQGSDGAVGFILKVDFRQIMPMVALEPVLDGFGEDLAWPTAFRIRRLRATGILIRMDVMRIHDIDPASGTFEEKAMRGAMGKLP